MNRHIKLILIVIFWASLPVQAQAFQFQGHRWQESIKEARRKLQGEHRNFTLVVSDTSLAYEDTFLGSPCSVTLSFTDRSKLLFMVELFVRSPGSSDKIKSFFVSEHGQPQDADEESRRFIWRDKDTGSLIAFEDTDEGTKIIYAAGESEKNE